MGIETWIKVTNKYVGFNLEGKEPYYFHASLTSPKANDPYRPFRSDLGGIHQNHRDVCLFGPFRLFCMHPSSSLVLSSSHLVFRFLVFGLLVSLKSCSGTPGENISSHKSVFSVFVFSFFVFRKN